jgi:hypothetical protein
MAPGKKTAMTPMAPQPAKEMAAPAASSAQDAGSKTVEQAPSAAAIAADKSLPLQKLKGVLQSFDANTGALVVKGNDGATQEFKVDAKAKITKGGDFTAITLLDLKQGDHVALGYRGTVVVSLHVKVIAAQ